MSTLHAKILFVDGPWDGASFKDIRQSTVPPQVYVKVDSVEMEKKGIPGFGRPERISVRNALCAFHRPPASMRAHTYVCRYQEPGLMVFMWAPHSEVHAA